MGVYAVPCAKCGDIFNWFSGNQENLCTKCVSELVSKDTNKIDDQKFHRRIDELICNWPVMMNDAFTEQELNSLIDLLGDDFKIQVVKIHAHGVHVGKELQKILDSSQEKKENKRLREALERIANETDENSNFTHSEDECQYYIDLARMTLKAKGEE